MADEIVYSWEPVTPSYNYKNRQNFGEPPEKQNAVLKAIGLAHTKSFDFAMSRGLDEIVEQMQPLEFKLADGRMVIVRVGSLKMSKPCVKDSAGHIKDLYPSECVGRACTYTASFDGKFQITVDDGEVKEVAKKFGEIPVMVGSEKCNLYGLSPAQLVEKKEHEQEWGAYFVIKGHKKVLRMLSATRKNYPIAVKRESWKKRGRNFTDKGVYIRCTRDDMSSTNNVLHYLGDGSMKLMCSYQMRLQFFPVILILRALNDQPDSFLYNQLCRGMEGDLYYKDRIAVTLTQLQQEGLYCRDHVRRYIGKSFRSTMYEVSPWHTDEQACQVFLKKSLLVHLHEDVDKFNLLIFMARKLYMFAQDKCALENTDPIMMQEIHLPGHIYLTLIKDRLEKLLTEIRLTTIKKEADKKKGTKANKGQFNVLKEMDSIIGNSSKFENPMNNFLATGNLPAKCDLGMQQSSGFSVMAENINRLRYMSHFRSVHRGAMFIGSQSSEVRQLKPDAWGFLCPVHTPDGSPCGLINHLSSTCQVTNALHDNKAIATVVTQLGMIPASRCEALSADAFYYHIMLEGRILGYVSHQKADRLVDDLRRLKIAGIRGIPQTLEIVLVPHIELGQYPGIYLFSGPGRMMRPVFHLAVKAVELIGTFEQVYMNICITAEEANELTTHQEVSETAFLSHLASLIPLPEFNQSPRNMYQCQMSKQTLGTGSHYYLNQTEAKLYRLMTPASPLLRPAHWDRIQMDDFPQGTNAVVAVISHTGYDMEDAMVINRGSLQRGFAYGIFYKNIIIDLKESDRTSDSPTFGRNPNDRSITKLSELIDEDGLPYIGRRLEQGQILYSWVDAKGIIYTTKKYEGTEVAYVDSIKLCDTGDKSGTLTKVIITIRIPRPPMIGDKFASRAGQKGICSQQCLTEDLPWTDSGLVPDIIFNPHGFPSRMTIAMMIELMAGKAGCVHGLVTDATPFRFSEDNTAIDYAGRLLEKAGYNYYGTEQMYNGLNGEQIKADIFFGIVHYQRLRHMVSDKYQVRSQGTMDQLTKQPVKGRKKGGGMRFGEMERDGLVSHGSLYLLYDRLFKCSDESTITVCRNCGTYLPPTIQLPTRAVKGGAYSREANFRQKCVRCPDGGKIDVVSAPYVFRYLLAELSSVNMRLTMAPTDDCTR